MRLPLLNLAFLREIVPTGLEFGANYLVEFEPHSLWFEASLTMAIDAMDKGIPVDYHTFMHLPDDVRTALVRLGANVSQLEEKSVLRIVDSYTVATSLGRVPPSSHARESAETESLDLAHWTAGDVEYVKRGVSEKEKKRFHIDDNTSVLVQYNGEQKFIDHWRTHTIPYVRNMQYAVLNSAVVGVYSDAFYKQVESLSDGIIDVIAREESGRVEHYFRARLIRGKSHDSKWHRIRLRENGHVQIDSEPSKPEHLGISGWLKGPK